jgi:hypothetical protein
LSGTGAGNATQTITGNTFSNWTGGTARYGMSINGFGISSVSKYYFNYIGTSNYYRFTYWCSWYSYSATNTINTLASGTGLVTGLFSANISPVVNIDLNTINGLASSLSIASASVHGV